MCRKGMSNVVSVSAVLILMFTSINATATTVEYQFFPDKTSPATQGFNLDSSAGGVETIGTSALGVTDSSTTAGGITYFAGHGGSQAQTFSMRALVSITDYTDGLERALFFLEQVTGRNTYGRIIRSGMAKTFDGKVKVGFVGADGEWIGSTYTTPAAEGGFVELHMLKPSYGTLASVSLFLDGVDTGLSVLGTDNAFEYVGNSTIQNFRFGTISGLAGGVPTGAVDIIGATSATNNYQDESGNWLPNLAPAIVIPEPVTMVLMASGALMALRRRRA